jgi:hypothetical protein
LVNIIQDTMGGVGGGVFQNLAKDPIVVFYITSNFKLSISSKLHRGVTLFTLVQAFSFGMQSRLMQPMRPNQVHWDLETG